MAKKHYLDRSSANVARLHRSELGTMYSELPETFKLREAKAVLDESGTGLFQKLRHAGLLDNEYAGSNEPKSWWLTQRATRWIEHQQAAD